MIARRRIQAYDPPQDQQRFFLLALLPQILQRIFIGPSRQFLVGVLQQLPEAYFLFPRWIGVPRQFLVSQAGSRRVRRRHLSLKQFAHQLHRLRSLIQRETQVGRHLPHIVILRIAFQDLQVFRQRVGRLSLLQQLFRLLDAAANLGTIRIFRHGAVWQDRVLHLDSRFRSQRQQRADPRARLRKSRGSRRDGRPREPALCEAEGFSRRTGAPDKPGVGGGVEQLGFASPPYLAPRPQILV